MEEGDHLRDGGAGHPLELGQLAEGQRAGAADGGEHRGLGGGEVAVAGLAELPGEAGDGQPQAAGQLGGLVGGGRRRHGDIISPN